MKVQSQGSPRSAYATDEQRWTAVAHRDDLADGAFVYSVKTTGVYCRPSCASRLARRENVAFHHSCEAAEAAGFRPCQRCRPRGTEPRARYRELVAKACRFIEAADPPPKLEALAASVGISPFHLHRVFKRIIGLSPKAYAAAQRAERLRSSLQEGRTVTEAIYAAGYNSNSRFYVNASSLLGMSPSRFRGGGIGLTIQFAIGESSLGSVLVGATEKGICAIFLGDDPSRLVADLKRRFHKARFIPGDRKFQHLVRDVVRLVEEPQESCDLPLDIRGTAFQQKVWEALRQIPPGTTATYTEIANRIKLPKAVRAVAQACGANPVAVAVPCHRVVRSDGNLAGYRWGVKRKETLLERERKKA